MEFREFMNVERRRKLRIHDPIPVIVRGSKVHGKGYQFETTARNVGSDGLCASAPRILKAGEKVTLFIRFALSGSKPLQAPVVAARAIVVRVQENANGSCIFAASFLHHRMI